MAKKKTVGKMKIPYVNKEMKTIFHVHFIILLSILFKMLKCKKKRIFIHVKKRIVPVILRFMCFSFSTDIINKMLLGNYYSIFSCCISQDGDNGITHLESPLILSVFVLK